MKIFLPFTIGLVLACTFAFAQRKPPNYSLDEMPDIITSFSCGDKVVGGYYADPETDCQMFHVCVKIPGVGVQDFRFLCPNDTSFDQENQICDDWYNIDCEASTLYYSDNFDLYRIGQDSNSFGPSKATPIPLGPSSIAPRPQKSRRPLSPVNNAVSEPDDDQYLYDGDRRAASDLLRGSSSGNFFNRNQGKEDPEDDYVAQKSPREQDLVKNQKKKQPKNNVRKLLTGKRPVASAPTIPPSAETYTSTVPTTSYNSQKNRYNTVQRNRPTTLNNQNYQTTVQPSRSFSNNFSGRFGQNNQDQSVQQETTTTTQGFNSFKNRGNQNYNAFNKKTEGADYYQDTTTYNYQNNGNSNYNQGSSQTNNYQTSTAVPYNSFKTNTNYNQGSSQSNYYQTPTSTNAPFNNYRSNSQVNYQQSQTTTNTPTQYNNQQSTTTAPNYNNYQNQNANTYQNYNSPSTENYYDATTLKPNYYQNYNQKQTTVNYDNYYKTSTQNYYQTEKSTEYPATDGAPFQNYYEKISKNNGQPKTTTNNQYNYNNANSQNAQASVNKASYDAYNSYQNSNADKYDEPSQGESLKTAPSSNIRPSDLNSFTKNYQKPGGFNTTLTASYNFNTAPSTTTQKPTSKFYQTKQYQEPSSGNSYNQSPSTVAPILNRGNSYNQSPSTVVPTLNRGNSYNPSSSTVAPTSNRGNSYYAQSTTAPPKPRPFSKPADAAPTSKPGKEKDASYDYAYYDDAGAASEYDGYEPVGEEFTRTTSAKKTRTTAK